MVSSLLGLTVAGLARAAAPPDPADRLHAAWKQAQKAGSYAFTADIEQTLIPRPTIYNIGRSDEHVALRAEGQVRLPDYSFLRLLPVLAPPGADLTPIEVERIGAETWVTMDGECKRMDDPAGLAAPTGDYLAYLGAARDVRELEPATVGGVRYERLAFTVDGPTFAEHVRRRMEEQVAADLPEGARLQPPRSLETLSGQGELWIGPDGLPRRQILELTVPDASDDYAAEARLVTDFADFGLHQAGKGTGGPVLYVRYANPRTRTERRRSMRKKERKLKLPPELPALLEKYQARYQPRERLFECTGRNLEYVLRDAAERAGIPGGIAFETLRWTCAVRDYRAGMDLETLRQKLGLSPVTWQYTAEKIQRLAGPEL